MILLVLPCNSGALEGNYFIGKYWKLADRYRDKNKVVLGAVDCIPVFAMGEKDGIVLETEMHKVKGHDIYPRYSKKKVDVLAEAIANGLKRIHKDFDKIIILLNVKLYGEATRKALEMLPDEIREKIEFIYINGYPGKFMKKIKEVLTNTS